MVMFLIILKYQSSGVCGLASFLLISVRMAICWSLVALLKGAPFLSWLTLSIAARPSVQFFLISADDSLIIRSMNSGTSASFAPFECSSVGMISSEIVAMSAIWSALKNFALYGAFFGSVLAACP